jgi:hypothetical protein
LILRTLPEPVPGLVIRYSYLWHSEHMAGHEEGRKDRPCAIVLALTRGETGKEVVVLPVTHSPPSKEQPAIEIPPAVKLRLGLDGQRSWVVLSEANLFSWPGPDLRPAVNGDLSTVSFGLLPRSFFHAIRDKFVRAFRGRRIRVVPRSE